MARRRCVRYRDITAVREGVKHSRHQPAGVQCDGFARLKVDLQTVGLADTLHALYQLYHVVAGLCDVVSAAEVQPLDFIEHEAEFLLDMR